MTIVVNFSENSSSWKARFLLIFNLSVHFPLPNPLFCEKKEKRTNAQLVDALMEAPGPQPEKRGHSAWSN